MEMQEQVFNAVFNSQSTTSSAQHLTLTLDCDSETIKRHSCQCETKSVNCGEEEELLKNNECDNNSEMLTTETTTSTSTLTSTQAERVSQQ